MKFLLFALFFLSSALFFSGCVSAPEEKMAVYSSKFYSFSYPEGWSVASTAETGELMLNASEGIGVTVSVIGDIRPATLDGYVDWQKANAASLASGLSSYAKSFELVSDEQFSLSGASGRRITFIMYFDDFDLMKDNIYIQNNGIVYCLSVVSKEYEFESAREQAEKVFSTLKFKN